MPIYEFECKDCGEAFEKLVPMSSQNLPECPKCNSRNVKKKISRTASGGLGCGSCGASSSGGCSSSRFT